jgi:hypothetical protein
MGRVLARSRAEVCTRSHGVSCGRNVSAASFLSCAAAFLLAVSLSTRSRQSIWRWKKGLERLAAAPADVEGALLAGDTAATAAAAVACVSFLRFSLLRAAAAASALCLASASARRARRSVPARGL